VRRPKSALGGRLELLAEATLTLHRGRNLDVIAQAQTLRSYWSQFVQPEALAAASLIAELVDLFCEPELPLDDIYSLLVNAAAALAAAPVPSALLPRFQLRLLDALGLAPPSDVCVRCGRPLDEHGAWVDVESGGLGCERCYGTRGNARALDAADVANFRALGAPRAGPVRATVDANPKVARAVDDIVTYHLGRRPKARALLDSFTP
jgi:DNA repair protein RecO (recombination protein O)